MPRPRAGLLVDAGIGAAIDCGSCTRSSPTRCTPTSGDRFASACTGKRPARSRQRTDGHRRPTSWSSSRGIARAAGWPGRSAAVVDARRRSGVRTARADRGVAPLPRRARHGDRDASSRRRTRRSARAARRGAAPGRRPASTRHPRGKAPTSPAAAARDDPLDPGRARVEPRLHADRPACDRSISRPSRRRSRSPTRPIPRPTRRLLALLAQSLVWTPDAERRVASAHQALELADAHHDPTLLARIAPGVLWGLWEPGSARRPVPRRGESGRGRRSIRRPAARVRRPSLGLRHRDRIRRSCDGRSQPREAPGDGAHHRRATTALDGRPGRHVHGDDGGPPRRSRGDRDREPSSSVCRSVRPTPSRSSPASSS